MKKVGGGGGGAAEGREGEGVWGVDGGKRVLETVCVEIE